MAPLRRRQFGLAAIAVAGALVVVRAGQQNVLPPLVLALDPAVKRYGVSLVRGQQADVRFAIKAGGDRGFAIAMAPARDTRAPVPERHDAWPWTSIEPGRSEGLIPVQDRPPHRVAEGSYRLITRREGEPAWQPTPDLFFVKYKVPFPGTRQPRQSWTQGDESGSEADEAGMADVEKQASASTVLIDAKRAGGRTGSGFVINSHGHVVTAFHNLYPDGHPGRAATEGIRVTFSTAAVPLRGGVVQTFEYEVHIKAFPPEAIPDAQLVVLRPKDAGSVALAACRETDRRELCGAQTDDQIEWEGRFPFWLPVVAVDRASNRLPFDRPANSLSIFAHNDAKVLAKVEPRDNFAPRGLYSPNLWTDQLRYLCACEQGFSGAPVVDRMLGLVWGVHLGKMPVENLQGYFARWAYDVVTAYEEAARSSPAGASPTANTNQRPATPTDRKP